MTAKQLLYREDARDKIRRGVDALANAVKVTLGPRGRTVILDREFGPPQIVNSGVIVAKAIELEDRFKNMGAQLLREVAARTSEMAGDGTTTATVLDYSTIQEVFPVRQRQPGGLPGGQHAVRVPAPALSRQSAAEGRYVVDDQPVALTHGGQPGSVGWPSTRPDNSSRLLISDQPQPHE